MGKLTDNIKKIFRLFGPGFITAAMVLGPGTITVCSRAGATTGYTLLWIISLSAVFMIFLTRVSAKIGCVSSNSLLTNTEEQYGRTIAVLMGVSICFSCAGFQTGNTIGVGLSMNALFGGNLILWAIIFLLITLIFIWTSSNFYSLLEKIMMVLVLLMVVAFIGNLFHVKIDGPELLKGFIPSMPSDLNLTVAIASTSFSVAGAAGQAYMVQGKNWKLSDLKKGLRDATTGILILCALSCIIVITSATVLFPKGIQVHSAVDMAIQLEPLLGAFSKWLFLAGLLAASFSSYVANAVMSGIFLAEALHLGHSINDRWVRIFASCVLVLGTLVPIVFKANPIQLIIFAQSMTILGAPIAAIVLFLISNNKKVMGEHRNTLFTNIVISLAIFWVICLFTNQLISLC